MDTLRMHPHLEPGDELVVVYKKRPALDGFKITVPPGDYTGAELIDMLMFEYQWQCDEAPEERVVYRF